MAELSSIPLKWEEKAGTVYIEVGTGLVYQRATDSLINPIAKIIGMNPEPTEPELRKAVATTLGRDEYSLTDEHIWSALAREVERRRRKSESVPHEILGIDIHDAIMGLKRAIENGKLVINSPMTIRALERISYGPDGRIDPSTVGPDVRATARAYIGMHPDDWATR